jgi:NADH:ubiquinone reductase (non-electrogenic)
VLGAFCEPLAQHATAHLAARGVAVRCRTGVTAVTGPHTATVKSLGGPAGAQADDDDDEEVLSFGALVWAAGIATRPLVHELASSLANAQAARESLPLGGGARGGGGVKGSCQPLPHRGVAVDGRLRVQGVADGSVFALGDCALSGLPPTAQVAAQQGKWLGRQLRDGTLRPIAAAGAGPETTAAADPPPFEYSDKGKMAYIGGHAAVATVVVPKLGASPVSVS